MEVRRRRNLKINVSARFVRKKFFVSKVGSTKRKNTSSFSYQKCFVTKRENKGGLCPNAFIVQI